MGARTLVRATALGWLLASLPAAGAAAVASAPPIPAATLWGAVLTPDGSRLPGARVVLTSPDGAPVVVIAGPLGIYRAAGLAPGVWGLTATSSGFAPLERPIHLAPGASQREDLRLALARVREDVIVEATADGESLEAPAIRESGARDLGEALAAIPGLWPLRKGGLGNDVVLRGLQSRDLNVVVDGDRVYGACPNHMDPPPFHVDFAEVERVDVGKGPFDVRYQGSLGGLVDIVTRDPEPGFHATPTLSVGSFAYLSPGATVSRGGERLSALAGLSWREGQADRDGEGQRFTQRANYRAEALDDRAFGAGTAWGRLRYGHSVDTSLEASYARQKATRVFYPYLLMDGVFDLTDRASLAFESRRQRRTVSLVTARAYLTRVDHWMTDEWRTSSATAPRGHSMGTQARALTWGLRVGGRVGRTTAGVEYYRRHWDATTELAGLGYRPQASIPGVDVDVLGAYADYSRIIGDRMLVEAGARFDAAWSQADERLAQTDLSYAHLGTRATFRRDLLPSGSWRLSWRPGTGLQFALALGHTARIPEANERFFALRRAGSDWVGDPGLEPSRNSGADASFAWRRSRFSLRGSVFANRITDFITVRDAERRHEVPGVTNLRARTWANVDAELVGSELSAAVALSRRLFISGELSWVRGSQDPRPELGITDTALPEMPPLRARTGLRFDDGRFFAAVDLLAAGRQERVANDLGEEASAGYTVLNGALGLRHRRLVITTGVQNLLDRAYTPHLSYQRDPFRTGVRVYDPGRTFYLNATLKL